MRLDVWMTFYLNSKMSVLIETTIDATNFGIVNMMKAIMNLQRTILNCPEGIFNRDEFVDNSLMKLKSLNKEERDDILMMELKHDFLGMLYSF